MSARTGLSELEEERLRAVLQDLPRRDAALILCGLHFGLRIHELLSLGVGQVWDGIAVQAQFAIARRRLKGGAGPRRRAVRSRVLPIHPIAAEAIHAYLDERGRLGPIAPDAPLFLSRERGRALSPCQAGRIVVGAIERAGLAGRGVWGTHSLRKAFARRIYEHSGHDLDLTRAALGHRYVATTQSYLGTSEEAAAQAILGLGPTSHSKHQVIAA